MHYQYDTPVVSCDTASVGSCHIRSRYQALAWLPNTAVCAEVLEDFVQATAKFKLDVVRFCHYGY